MKYFIFCLLGMIFFLSCEEDDICLDEKTPQMIFKLDYQNIEDTLRIDSLVIFRKNIDNNFENIYRSTFDKTDSLAVSLLLEDVDETQFIISKRTYDTSLYDTLTVRYTRELEFGSKACGYKVNYIDVNYNITSHFFVELEALQNDITNETTAHLQLYY